MVRTGSPIRSSARCAANALMSVKRNDPRYHTSVSAPRMNPASPMRFTMNALFAASLADLRWK